ncbi:DNA phosphorothioation-dependent restriction protein DptF [Metabacillus indicus]|uniref:DNA phosphorothioation-dependent restriction protein DptF n=1 Tax=Metabacillus indicus TaxID=246786 RepID=UPI00317D663E
MSNEANHFLHFLNKINPTAANNAQKMEDLIFEDPSSAIIKARVFAEGILNEVFKQEQDNIESPYLSTLFEKISFLSKEGYIKREIQQSLDIIRMSGNKAAHDGNYNDITEAFKLHKEMYKVGVWFYEVYSLDQLSIPQYEPPKPPRNDAIEDIVRKQILEFLGSSKLNELDIYKGFKDDNMTSLQGETIVEERFSIINKDLKKDESYLLRELSRLKDNSQEAIENASQFSAFKNYLHVDRKIQLEIEEILIKNHERQESNLILLCGSVGDGKSHLLAYLKENKPELISEYTIFNDATESFSPNKNAMETLEEVLHNFSDEKINLSNDKVILAINLGVLHNFINTKHSNYSYNHLKKFIEDSDLFSQKITTYFGNDKFDLLSFSDFHSFELTETGPKSSFYSSLLEKIFNSSNDNPFYLALKEDENKNLETMIHKNYKFMQNKFVQDQIVNLIIQTVVKKKLVISARAFLNLIADILIPDDIHNLNDINEFDVLEYCLPNLLFNRKERSIILQALSELDPIHRRSVFIDQLIVELNTLNDWRNVTEVYINDEIAEKWLKPFASKSNLTNSSFNIFFESFIRITFLTNKKFAYNICDISYESYTKNLYYFNSGNNAKIKLFYEEVKTSIFKWKGSPKKEYLFLNKPIEKYRLAQKLNIRPTIEHLTPIKADVLNTFRSTIVLAYHDGNSNNKIYLEIDFPLYKLLMKVKEGYRPNKKDEEDAINFVEFIDKLMKFGEKKKEIIVCFPRDNRFYMIKRDDFGAFVFERE